MHIRTDGHDRDGNYRREKSNRGVTSKNHRDTFSEYLFGSVVESKTMDAILSGGLTRRKRNAKKPRECWPTIAGHLHSKSNGNLLRQFSFYRGDKSFRFRVCSRFKTFYDFALFADEELLEVPANLAFETWVGFFRREELV